MKRTSNDEYKLSTGRELYANQGIIGISPKATGQALEYQNEWIISHGFDGYVYIEDELTPEEKRELADFMIDLWQQFKRDA